MNVVISKYAYILQKIYWFLYLQMLWMIFSLLGLVVFGVFPATHALFTVLKEGAELTSKEAFRIFRNAFKVSFVKLSLSAIIWELMIILISTNLVIFNSLFIKFIVMGMLGLILLSIIHFFQYFEVEKPIIFQIKRAFSLVFIMPKNNVGYMFIFVLLLLAIVFIPGITFFLGVSIAVFFTVKIGGSQKSKRQIALLTEGSSEFS